MNSGSDILDKAALSITTELAHDHCDNATTRQHQWCRLIPLSSPRYVPSRCHWTASSLVPTTRWSGCSVTGSSTRHRSAGSAARWRMRSRSCHGRRLHPVGPDCHGLAGDSLLLGLDERLLRQNVAIPMPRAGGRQPVRRPQARCGSTRSRHGRQTFLGFRRCRRPKCATQGRSRLLCILKRQVRYRPGMDVTTAAVIRGGHRTGSAKMCG
jgi:hypothetical protein